MNQLFGMELRNQPVAEVYITWVLIEIDNHAKGVLHTHAGIYSQYNEGWDK